MNRFELCEALAGALEAKAKANFDHAVSEVYRIKRLGVGEWSASLLATAEMAQKQAFVELLAFQEAARLIRNPDRLLSCNSTHSKTLEPIS